MDRKIIIAAIVVVVVIIAAACVIVLNNDDDNDDEKKGDTPTVVSTGRVPIYGNVNNDDYLNADDVTALRALVSDIEGGATWDQTKYPYADVNQDGKINSDDISYLQNIIDKKNSTKLYYVSTWGNVVSCNWPDTTTGNIGTMYWEQASLTVLLGLWNTRVTACGSGSLSDLTNPGWKNLYSYDSNGGKGYNASVETVLASATNSAKVVSLVAYMQGDGTAKDIYDAAVASKSTLNVLVPSNADDLSYVLTMGVLLGAEERAHQYVSIVDGNINYMKEKTSKYTEATAPTVMVCMIKGATTTSDILVLGPATTGSANGMYKYMTKTPSKVIVPSPYPSFYTQVTAEWIVEQNPDYILFCSAGAWSGSADDATIQSAAEATALKFFGGTNAYKNGHIICSANGTMNSFIGGFAFLELIKTIYPEIDSDYADKMFASYFKSGDGWVNYDLEDSPTYKIRVVGNTSSDDDNVVATGRVPIYGNVNNDDSLDSKDLSALNKLVSSIQSGAAWDKEKYPYADVNQDGKIDSSDVTYLQNILNKKNSTKLYYVSTWGDVASCNWPDTTTGNIGTMYWEQASLTVLLGLWNTRVTACGSGSLSDLTNPGWKNLYSYDSNGGKGYNASVETVLASATNSAKVVSIVAYMQSDGTAKDIYDAAIASKSTMNVLVPSNADDLSYVLTMGILLGAEDRAEKYVSIVDGNIEYMKEKTSKYTESTAPTVMVCMIKGATTTSDILVLGPSSSGSANGLYKYMTKTPSKVIEPDPMTRYYTQVSADWIATQNPDYILFCSSGLWSGSSDDATIQASAQAAAQKFFGGTDAYKNNHIICTANGTMNSFIGGFAFLELIKTIYPEIDSSYADQMYASYFKSGDGWVNYDLEDSPTYKIRVVGASS